MEYFQVSDVLDAYKMKDSLQLSNYISSYIAGRALLDCNIHPAPTKFFKINKPTCFSLYSKTEENKENVLRNVEKPADMSWVVFLTEVDGFFSKKIDKMKQEEAEENLLWQEITESLNNFSV